MKIKKNLLITISLFLLIILEIFVLNSTLTSKLLVGFNLDEKAIIFFLCGISISILPLLSSFSCQIKSITIEAKRCSKIDFLAKFGMILSVIYLIRKVFIVLNQTPIDYKVADMLPIIKTMNQRYFNGEDVYKIIPEIWGGMQPIYLPSMWLPFAPSIWFDFDMRWISFLLLILASLLFLWEDLIRSRLINYFPTFILCFYFLFCIIRNDGDHRILSMTEEPVVIFYYSLLGYALINKNFNLLALALALSFTSRYAILPWAITFFIYYFFYQNKKEILKTGLLTIVMTFLILFVFQGFDNLKVFLNLHNIYISSIKNENSKYMPLIDSGIGLARFIAYQNLKYLQYFQIALTFIAPASLFAICRKYFNSEKMVFSAICSLKLSLVTFSSFIVMPYIYLFYPSVFLSILLFYKYFSSLQEEV